LFIADKDTRICDSLIIYTAENNDEMLELPHIQEPVFLLRRLKFEYEDVKHSKYHKELSRESMIN
jgi:hypothetical protein